MSGASVWSDAITAIQLFAVDPHGTGGIVLRSRAGPVRERWLAMLRAALAPSCVFKHLPLHIADSRLLGGLDLDATLRAGRPVAERGLLADADGGVLVLAMAERISAATTAHVTAAMDAREIRVERDGLSLRMPTRFGVVATDEGLDDEVVPSAIKDRLAFHVDLNDLAIGDAEPFVIAGEALADARARVSSVTIAPAQIDALCTAAAALGIVSLRAPLLALRVARASAALAGNSAVDQDDIALAARLVLAPRALVFPQDEQALEPEEASEPPPEDEADRAGDEDHITDMHRALDEVILAAVQSAIPPDVLAAIRAGAMVRPRSRSSGKAGALQKSGSRGRPNGVSRGVLRAGARLNVIETLRAAAPWQVLRRREATASDGPRPLVFIRKDDFRIARFKQRRETVTIFVVDASGSAALHRLAEAKGAVELLLADCYVRRDQVALIAFRGDAAELLLPPTRSLARAKRSLAGLPGGGGTPLAAGLDAAFALADLVTRKGQTPTVILLTDGRANIARDGAPGRPLAEEDAVSAARRFRAAGTVSVLLDTSPRAGSLAAQFAKEMGAKYLPLPHADAAALSKAVLASIG